MMPGSLNDVRKRELIVNTNKIPPMIGIAGVIRSARKGQLQTKSKRLSLLVRQNRTMNQQETANNTYSNAKNSPLVPVMSTTVK